MVQPATFPSLANGKQTPAFCCAAAPVTGAAVPGLVITPTQTSFPQIVKTIGGTGWRRGRDSNSRSLTGRRFSRPVVSTAHPPLPKVGTLTRWCASVRPSRNSQQSLHPREGFCNVLTLALKIAAGSNPKSNYFAIPPRQHRYCRPDSHRLQENIAPTLQFQ